LERLVITIVGVTVLLIFAWLKIPLKDIAENSSSQVFVRFALLMLYFGWFFGLKTEVNIQEAVTIIDPNQGHIPKGMFFAVPFLVLTAVVVLWVSNNERHLSVALGFLLIADVVFYVVAAQTAGPCLIVLNVYVHHAGIM
jgi:hypothetical protein